MWPRCKGVTIDDDCIVCEIDQENAYDLADAYKDAPHSHFLNCSSPAELCEFIETYGPLFLATKDGRPVLLPRDDKQPLKSLAFYWKFQRWLKSLLKLIRALKDSTGVRQAMIDFFDADLAADRGDLNLRSFRHEAPAGLRLAQFMKMRDPQSAMGLGEWLRNMPESFVLDAAAVLVHASIVVRSRLLVRRKGMRKGRAVLARPVLVNLGQAIEWMCWEDEFLKNPLEFCQACERSFRPKSGHRRKYCGNKCAQKMASKEYRRRESLKKRREDRIRNKASRGRR